MNKNCDFLMNCTIDQFEKWLNKYNTNKTKSVIDGIPVFIEFYISIYGNTFRTVYIFEGSFKDILSQLRFAIENIQELDSQIFINENIHVLQITNISDIYYLTDVMYDFIRMDSDIFINAMHGFINVSMDEFINTMNKYFDIKNKPQGTA